MKRHTIAIVGMGFSGITAGVKILSESEDAVDVIFIEKCDSNQCGGVAYGPGSAEPYHQTNISASRMGVNAGDSISNSRVLNRLEFGQSLRRLYENTAYNKRNAASNAQTLSAQVMSLREENDSVLVELDNGVVISADQVIVATGNHEIKQIGCVSDTDLADPNFAKRYVHNQWLESEKRELDNVPSDAPVLVIGSALSGYDAVRSLLRRGHEGPITMTSRNGYEHFQYPENHTWEMADLPVPRFMYEMHGLEEWPTDHEIGAVFDIMLDEFKDLTGYDINRHTGEVTYEEPQKPKKFSLGGSDLLKAFDRARLNAKSEPKPEPKRYLPEQVIQNWEQYLSSIIDRFGVDRYGRFLSKYTSLITTMRVGAGYDICEEIKAAKARGQLEVLAAGVGNIASNGYSDYHKMGVDLLFTRPEDNGGVAKERRFYHTVVSSLGANHNYAKTRDPLWTNILDEGYTQPHRVGIGVEIRTDLANFGRLPKAERIYATGTPTAGANMLVRNVIGPPAFSVPGMRQGIIDTADAVLDAIRADGRQLALQDDILAARQFGGHDDGQTAEEDGSFGWLRRGLKRYGLWG